MDNLMLNTAMKIEMEEKKMNASRSLIIKSLLEVVISLLVVIVMMKPALRKMYIKHSLNTKNPLSREMPKKHVMLDIVI